MFGAPPQKLNNIFWHCPRLGNLIHNFLFKHLRKTTKTKGPDFRAPFSAPYRGSKPPPGAIFTLPEAFQLHCIARLRICSRLRTGPCTWHVPRRDGLSAAITTTTTIITTATASPCSRKQPSIQIWQAEQADGKSYNSLRYDRAKWRAIPRGCGTALLPKNCIILCPSAKM